MINKNLCFLCHSLPRPINAEVAKKCEEVIRSQGATPATIFINKGCVHIGAEPDELELLCMTDEPAIKVSRRDLPGVLGARSTRWYNCKWNLSMCSCGRDRSLCHWWFGWGSSWG